MQAALDWIEEHPNYAPNNDKGREGENVSDKLEHHQSLSADQKEEIPEGFKKALKCSQCEKTFASVELAQLHATKTGHDDFSESLAKQLTGEEKAQKLQELKARLEEKRAAEMSSERDKQVENERIRRKTGREAEQVRREREMKQLEKLRMEQRREQEEAQRAKERVLKMIEEDRQEREKKRGISLQNDDEKSTKGPELKPPTPTDIARVQVKLFDGSSLKYIMKSTDTFHNLMEKIAIDRPILNGRSFLVIPGNRRLTATDYQTTLESLGMSPSVTLMPQ